MTYDPPPGSVTMFKTLKKIHVFVPRFNSSNYYNILQQLGKLYNY